MPVASSGKMRIIVRDWESGVNVPWCVDRTFVKAKNLSRQMANSIAVNAPYGLPKIF